ncbi:MAG: HesA/MoeB/ThiF family protein [Bacteroidota bacterium]
MHEERYKRHFSLEEVGEEGQSLLSRSTVLVVGCGGLGVPVIQYLGGAGIGHLILFDGDQVTYSNLPRQVLYGEGDVGGSKSMIAAEKIKANNSGIAVSAFEKHLTVEEGLEVPWKIDVILDCTDNFASRYLINDLALLIDVPVVSGALHKFDAQMTVYNYHGGPTYRCLFPNENQRGFGCDQVGVLGPLAGLIGNYMALESMKILLKTGRVLSGCLRTFNGLSHAWNDFSYEKNEMEVEMRKTELATFYSKKQYG